MAKLSQTFKIEGGSNTAPVSYGSGKLSQTFTIGQKSVLPDLQQSKPVTPIPNYDTNVIKEYESLPKTDIFSRLFNKESRDAYKRKQELNPLYEQNKDLQTQKRLSALGITDDDITTARVSANPNSEIKKLLQNKGVTDKAEIKALTKSINERATRSDIKTGTENMAKFSDEHPVLGTLMSEPVKVASDALGMLENPARYISGKPFTNTSGGNAGTRMYQGMREAVSDDMSGLGKFAYGVGTSIMDMAPIIALGGNAGLGYAGASAMQGSIPDLIDRGLTPNQIMFTSLANGTAEALLEKLPLGNLEKWASQPIEKTFKSIAKVIGSQMLSEGIEETGTDIANTIFDALINGDKAELNQNIQKNGFWPAMWDYIKQVGYDGLAGAVSGGVMGGGNVGVNMVRNGLANIPTLEQTSEVTTPVEQPAVITPNDVKTEGATTQAIPEKKLSKTFTIDNVNPSPTSVDLTGENVKPTIPTLEESRAVQEPTESEIDDFEDDDDEWINADLEDNDAELTMEIGGLVPTITDENGTTSRVATNSYAKFFEYDEEGLNHLIDNIEDGKYQKQVKGMKATYDNAIREIEKYSPDAKFADLMEKGINTDDDIALGHNLLKYYSEVGDTAKVDSLLLQIQRGGTEIGRALHYFQIFGDSPLGVQQATNAIVGSKIKEFNNDAKKNKNGKKAKQLKQIEEISNKFIDFAKSQSETDSSEKSQKNKKKRTRRTKAEAERRPLNRKLARAFEQLQNGKKENVKVEKTHEQIRQEVINTLEKYAPFKKFSDEQIDVITNYVETGRVNVDLLAQEMKNVLALDKFFIVDESTPLPQQKGNAKFQSALDLLTNGRKKTEVKEKSLGQIRREIEATLGADVDSFSDHALEFLTYLVDNPKVSNEEIADELQHYMQTGEFYLLEEDIEPRKPISGKLQSILNEMGADRELVEKKHKTYEEIREEVQNTLEKEMASIDFSDDEISYFARLLANNVPREDIANALTRKVVTGQMHMSDEDIAKINSLYEQADLAETSKESAELKKQAAQIASEYLGPVSWMEKVNAWRYLAMLGNPRTMIRNRVGNRTFGAVTDVKDVIGAMLEKAFIKDGKRTKAVLTQADSKLKKASSDDFLKVAYEKATEGGSKYNMKTEIENAQRIFNNKALEKWRTLTNNELEGSDVKALQRKYAKALAGYLKANGYNESVFETDNPILEDARAYAINQAKEATFHADNNFAQLLQKISDKARESGGASGKVLEVIVESLAPFKKTPANILQQGFEYSPLGMLKLISQINNQAGANAYIETISKSLTGLGLMGLGAWLSSMGLLVGQRDDEDDPFNKGANYALKIGNHTYTIDWAAPAALPLFVGQELYEHFTPNGTAEETKDFFEALASVSEPMVEMSMLQGLSNTIDAIANSKKSKMSTTIANIGTGYASQMIPTLAGQIARTIDPYRRSTRTNSSSYKNPVLSTLEKAGEKVVNKIPGLSMTNQKYIDVWGDEQKNTGGNLFGRAVQNFLSPGYFNDVSMTDREKKLADLQRTYEGNGSLIPSLAPSNKPDGSRMTNAEYEKWAKARGQELGKAVDAALKYKGNGTKTEDLQEYIHDIENFANAVAMNKQFKKPIAKTYEKAYEAYKLNGYAGVMEYYRMLNGADLDGNGSVTQEELAKYLRSSDIPRGQREDYFKIKFPKAKEIPTLR